MNFDIKTDDSPAERRLKYELNSLFSQEEIDLDRLGEPYFALIEWGGLVHASKCPRSRSEDGYEIGHKWFPIETVENLVEKKAIGKRDRTLRGIAEIDFLFFDNFDATFNNIAKHPIGIEAYYELKYEAKHSDKDMPILLDKVLAKYDKLHEVFKRATRSKLLATAIALTCRGEYQCPVNMKYYFQTAGGFSAVKRAGDMIGEEIRYDPDARVKAFIPKLGLNKESLRAYMEIWRKERGKVPVMNAYVGGLAYTAMKLGGQPKTQKDVAELVGASEVAVRDSAREIAVRQGIKEQRGLTRDEAREINEEFQKIFGLPAYFTVLHYKKADLETRMEIAEYLMERGFNDKNPVSKSELMEEFDLTFTRFNSVVRESHTSHLALAKVGVHCDGLVYVEEPEKVGKFIKLTKELVKKLNY